MVRLVRDEKGRWAKPPRKSWRAIAGEVGRSRALLAVATALGTFVATLAFVQPSRAPVPSAAPRATQTAARLPAATSPVIRPIARPVPVWRPAQPRQWPDNLTCYYAYRKGPC